MQYLIGKCVPTAHFQFLDLATEDRNLYDETEIVIIWLAHCEILLILVKLDEG